MELEIRAWWKKKLAHNFYMNLYNNTKKKKEMNGFHYMDFLWFSRHSSKK